MATIRRDTAPRKDKTGPPSSTPLKATSKTNPPPIIAPKKPTPTTSLRPASSRSSSGLKKPTPQLVNTNKPTNVARKTLDKTPLPTPKTRVVPSTRPHDKTTLPPAQKTHASAVPSPRPRDKTPLPARNTSTPPHSSSLTGKPATAPQKVGLGKNPNPNPKPLLYRDIVIGKQSLSSHATPVKTSSVCIQQEQETQRSPTSATKEQVAESKFQESVGNTDIYENLPEVETLLEGQESFTFETAEQIVSGDQKGDIVGEDDDAEDIVQIEAEDDAAEEEDVKIVASELSPVLEQQEAPHDMKAQEPEEKLCVEEKLEELISVTKIDISNNNITTGVADELPKEEVKEKVVEEVIVVEKEKAVDQVAGQSEAHASVETKVQEVVEKQKQEAENKAQKQVWPRVKKDAVSNDKIEEIMLRDQKRNRVRALAGAFESVISSQ